MGDLKGTAQKHGIRQGGELVSGSGCSEVNNIRAATPHHTTAWAQASMELFDVDTTGSDPNILGGSRYVIMFVDSAARLQ